MSRSSTLDMRNDRSKLPGYTGHIPYKNELIGVTTGEANKLSY